MSHLLKKALPWNWFKDIDEEAASQNKRKARRAIAGGKRKADDTLEPGPKKKHRSSRPFFWSGMDIQQWMNESGQIYRGPKSSVAHATTITDFDAQVQLQQEAANAGARHEVLIQTAQSPHSEGQGIPHSALPPPSMPPPPTRNKRVPVSRRPPRQSLAWERKQNDVENRSNASVAQSSVSKPRLPQPDTFDLEKARRHAAAVSLPENSGTWALSEKQLLYHLALRGFEPLLPENWMVDFKTLPLSLFDNQDSDPALIQVQQGTQFRAVRALRELVETGKLVRDKSLCSPGFHAEKTIEKAVKSYFAWALSDGGFKTDTYEYIPIYNMMTRRKGQTTAGAISTLSKKLHKLAARHRARLGIQSSIESATSHELLNFLDSETQVYDDSGPEEPPVLVGILGVSSIVVIFTLNARNAVTSEDIDESGLRFIAKFDFSDATYDVWNAIAVAITVMHVRESMASNGFEKIIKDELDENGDLVRIKKEPGADETQSENGEVDLNASPGRMVKSRRKSVQRGHGKGKNLVARGGWHGNQYGEYQSEQENTVVVDEDDPDL